MTLATLRPSDTTSTHVERPFQHGILVSQSCTKPFEFYSNTDIIFACHSNNVSWESHYRHIFSQLDHCGHSFEDQLYGAFGFGGMPRFLPTRDDHLRCSKLASGMSSLIWRQPEPEFYGLKEIKRMLFPNFMKASIAPGVNKTSS